MLQRPGVLAAAEPGAAPDRGRITVSRDNKLLQRPRQVSFGVRHPLRHALIEKLAGTIAQRVPEDGRLTRVSVTIRKPAALDHGEPGVTLWRDQES